MKYTLVVPMDLLLVGIYNVTCVTQLSAAICASTATSETSQFIFYVQRQQQKIN